MKAILFLGVLVVCLTSRCTSAPLTESNEDNEERQPLKINKEIFEGKDIIEQEPISLDEDEASGEGSGNEDDFIPPSKEEEEDITGEKVNFDGFGIDYDGFEKQENDLLENDIDGRKCDISFETARQLASSLDRPSAIADYIISTNDIESFICVIEILIENGLISEDEADYLEEEVSNELQKQLYDDVTYYDDGPFEMDLEEQFVPESNEEIMYPDLDEVITADMDELLYDLAQTLYNQPPQEQDAAEKTLIQFAGLIAREVILGNLSPEEGEGYLDVLAQLPFGQILDQEDAEEEEEVDIEEEEEDGDKIEEKVIFDDLDELEEELMNSAKTNNKAQETYYPENEDKFGAFPEYKDNYLDGFRENIVWLDDYDILPPTSEEIAELEDTDVADLAADLGDILEYYVGTGKLSDEDVQGIRDLLI